MSGSSSDQDRLAEFDVNDPALEPGTRVQKLPPVTSKLGGAIPVRFKPETIDAIKQVAEKDGVSVSAWIRREIDDSLNRYTSLQFHSNVYPIRMNLVLESIEAENRRSQAKVAI